MSKFDEALRFGGFVLAHAAWIASDLEDGDLVCPFAVIKRGAEQKVIRFESSSQAESIALGKRSLVEFRDTVDYWGFAREGLLSIVGSDSPTLDVLAISAWRNGLDKPIVLHQCFVAKATGKFRLLGQPTIAVHGAELSEDVQLKLRIFVMQGIAQHPQGGLWAGWT